MPPPNESTGLLICTAVIAIIMAGCACRILRKKQRTEFDQKYATVLGACAAFVVFLVVYTAWYTHDGQAFMFSDLPAGHWKILVTDNDLGNTLIQNEDTGVVFHTRLIVGREYPSEFVRLDGKDYPVMPQPSADLATKQ